MNRRENLIRNEIDKNKLSISIVNKFDTIEEETAVKFYEVSLNSAVSGGSINAGNIVPVYNIGFETQTDDTESELYNHAVEAKISKKVIGESHRLKKIGVFVGKKDYSKDEGLRLKENNITTLQKIDIFVKKRCYDLKAELTPVDLPDIELRTEREIKSKKRLIVSENDIPIITSETYEVKKSDNKVGSHSVPSIKKISVDVEKQKMAFKPTVLQSIGHIDIRNSSFKADVNVQSNHVEVKDIKMKMVNEAIKKAISELNRQSLTNRSIKKIKMSYIDSVHEKMPGDEFFNEKMKIEIINLSELLKEHG